jgi:CheY-like chemotaxis protein
MPDPAAEVAEPAGRSVVLIEDESTILRFLRAALSGHGCRLAAE